MKKLSIITVVVLGVMLTTGAACSKEEPTTDLAQNTSPAEAIGKTDDAEPASQLTIDIKEFEFAPKEDKVAKGSTIVWTNEDSAPHTVKFSDGESVRLKKGATFEKTFNEAGTFDYSCGVHPNMKASVIVE